MFPCHFTKNLNCCSYWKLYLCNINNGREYQIETDGVRCQKAGMLFLEKDSNVNPVSAWKCKHSQFLHRNNCDLKSQARSTPCINTQTRPCLAVPSTAPVRDGMFPKLSCSWGQEKMNHQPLYAGFTMMCRIPWHSLHLTRQNQSHKTLKSKSLTSAIYSIH